MKTAVSLASASLLFVLSLGGCDRNKEKTQTFTWRDAVEASPAEAVEALGPYSGCDPSREWPPPRDELLSVRPCEFPKGREQERPADYEVSRIMYAENEPKAVWLAPTDELRLSEAISAFDLPELPVLRHRTFSFESDEHRHRVRSYRRRARPDDGGRVVAIDVHATPKAPDRVDFVELEVARGRHLLDPVFAPQPVSPSLTLPPTRTSFRPDEDLPYVEMRLDGGRVAPGIPVYPERSEPSGDLSLPEARTIPADSVSDPSAWSETLSAFSEEYRTYMRTLGRASGSAFYLGADETEPFGSVIELLRIAERNDFRNVGLIGRAVERLGEDRTQFSPLSPLRASFESTPSSSDSDRRGRPPTPLLSIKHDGFDIEVDGTRRPAIDGCPSDGPTICLRNPDVDIAAASREARSLRRDGETEKGFRRLDALLDAYDWAGLHRVLVSEAELSPEGHTVDSDIRLRTHPDLPVAVAARAMNVAGWRLTVPGKDGCVAELTHEQLRAARRCRRKRPATETPMPVGLFNDPILHPYHEVGGDAGPTAPPESR